MNKFVRFLVHTAIIAVLFIALGVGGSEIDNDAGGSISTVSFFALVGLPIFIVLQLGFDALEDIDNVIVSFLRGALVVIGLIAAALSFLLQQGLYAGQDAGTISNVFLASFVAAFPFSMITGIYFYFGLQFTDAKWKALIVPVLSYLASFVVNLICTLLGKFVAPFFYGWFLFAVVAVLIVVLIIVFIKCGSDWTEKIYPSAPTAKAKPMDDDERKLRYLLNELKNDPKRYLKYQDVTYYTPWSYSLNVSQKRLSFSGAFSLSGYQPSREGERMMNGEMEDFLKKVLDLVAEGNSYYKSYNWSVQANMTMR